MDADTSEIRVICANFTIENYYSNRLSSENEPKRVPQFVLLSSSYRNLISLHGHTENNAFHSSSHSHFPAMSMNKSSLI